MSVKSGRGTCVIFLICFKAKRIRESGGAGVQGVASPTDSPNICTTGIFGFCGERKTGRI